ncbi:TetR family transcriptional regulator [Mycolicibacterium sp. CR10]|uniref:TetR family transcriptional regulator n=1 Tax=Mycolicibacterium sp. CR10 TaxID=2562314 RepID=UPI0010C08831|nr:TetR family transcriptional regulator [Mycolicibacterium sp. CR10]
MAEARGAPVLGLRERKKRRTRATLIDAAVGLCDRQGFDGTTVDQIAAIADVSPRTFSRYFATKDAIALALVDEVLDIAARELALQPVELGNFEALRRAYLAMAEHTKFASEGALSSKRLLQILRITLSSATLRQAAVEFRASAVDVVLAERMGVSVNNRRVKLVAAVWGAFVITALQQVALDMAHATTVSIDDVVDAFGATYAEFAVEVAGLKEPV